MRALAVLVAIQAFLAKYRLLLVSTAGVLAPALLALTLRALVEPTPARDWLWLWLVLYIPAQVVLIAASLAPPRYAQITLLEAK